MFLLNSFEKKSPGKHNSNKLTQHAHNVCLLRQFSTIKFVCHVRTCFRVIRWSRRKTHSLVNNSQAASRRLRSLFEIGWSRTDVQFTSSTTSRQWASYDIRKSIGWLLSNISNWMSLVLRWRFQQIRSDAVIEILSAIHGEGDTLKLNEFTSYLTSQ